MWCCRWREVPGVASYVADSEIIDGAREVTSAAARISSDLSTVDDDTCVGCCGCSDNYPVDVELNVVSACPMSNDCHVSPATGVCVHESASRHCDTCN